MLKRKFPILFALLLSFGIFSNAITAQNNSITVKNIGWGKVDFKGFTLKDEAAIKLVGSAALYNKRGNKDFAYCWILNGDSREVVWSIFKDLGYSWDDNEGRFEFEKEVKLKKGNYEVYYTTGGNYNNNFNLGGLLDDIFGSTSKRSLRRGDKNLFLEVSGPSDSFIGTKGTENVDQKSKVAIASIVRTRDDKHLKKGFTLSGEVNVRIYSIGEGYGNTINDYAWITDVRTNKRIWIMDPDDADHAGGGSKNFYVNKDMTLPAGSYMLHYVTDDSHSFQEWNVAPPMDPQFWGATIWCMEKSDYSKILPFDESSIAKPIVDLTRVRDNENLSKGFTLETAMDLRIQCLGESGGSDMADYGYIINADTRKVVWEMKNHKTESAGGSYKNRMIDEIVRFEKGNYIAYYLTDDSHAFNDWNDDPPFDPEQWGISIWPVDEKDKNNIKVFSEENFKSKDIIAQLIRVRNDEHARKSFTLTKETKIRIFAIGEGSGDLVDYGWIENDANGRSVWEMEYDNTERAGGASKNRLFIGTITLPKGDYILHYRTDDSHSYRRWNETPPRDAEMYGITLYYE